MSTKHIGAGIALGAIAVCATVLEINGKPSGGLWVLVVIWAICF